jgi:NADH dehydrogenase
MNKRDVCVLGGTGFVGQKLVTALSSAGWRVRVLSRRRERYRELLVLPNVDVIEANVLDEGVLREHFLGTAAVINLIGILNERRRGDFQAVHIDLPRRIASACSLLGVPRLLHMSALNADAASGPSQYLRSKGEGEDVAHAADDIAVTSFRPSVIFGPGDHFFSQFATLIKLAPGMLPLACPDARFAPVYVGDVVTAFVKAITDKNTWGQRYELCGPGAYSLRELFEFTVAVSGRRCTVIGLPDALSAIQARVMGMLPGKPLTYDNYLSMQVDGVCAGGFPEVFGVVPASIDSVVPRYVVSKGDPFDAIRYRARHD